MTKTIAQKINDLPNIRHYLNKYGFFTKKKLGQNFLFDLNLTDKIARAAGNLQGKSVIEIGGGPAGLTRMIMANNPDKLIVIEHDPRCIPIQKELQEICENHLEVIEGDALKINERQILRDFGIAAPVKIIANLPYNIGTELLFKWLGDLELYESMTLMFQKEVAMRIIAKPRTKQYGILSVIAQFYCNCYKNFDVNPSAFFPPPKVTSSVITLVPRKTKLANIDEDIFKKICKTAFGQRRKTLKSSLKKIINNPEELLLKADISPICRPEELEVIDFCRLTEVYSEQYEKGK